MGRAEAPLVDDISKALAPLRSVVQSLQQAASGDIPTGATRRKLVRCVRTAGNAAVPTLIRGLASAVETESTWAYYLLARLGGERVIGKVGRLLEDPQIADDVKARAMGLLSELDAPIPADASLQDPEALLEKSVKDLLESLDEDEEVAQAVDLIVEQVPEDELPAFAAEVVKHGGRRAVPLLEALCHRRGLSDETLEVLQDLRRQASASRAERAAAQALDRGLEYLEAGKPRAARRRLERYVAATPRHAEGRSALGICLLQLDEYDQALAHLTEAASLEPEEPLHRWNLAAAAKQADRMGGAYLALRDYLALTDDGEGAMPRRAEARSFVRAYERMLRDSHPGVALSDYLRGEELFARAFAALSEGRADEAVRGFEAVLALVPRHYPSWGNLGAAYLSLDNKHDAERCLQQALALNPDYTVARKNLELL
jgi:Flp pilus assembly protein TadD